ncbi:CDP-diacylglycerol--glycerol-3-phosphate 3-phosphatidyltransferase [Idiomarina tyrosinivorans]|uniref:CDP-diacylglycerol--glycerol-3-phosphate 3-phosphatidyltransferase n=1 Tax=Idiomarina tyrosinivorans TaxID=1445662 RepID=A0A432ZTT7_9GAMM|nr:CDP-diacylglycerol--glycerol-3-phosphate 3-phosphatidyltransferase [Idiomarina tyrosinivorans]RUO81261.1 CDP-diacylglycerol--glycerol-3-phosphate 3-phosphatidyltransferase [Idiomarina tyrosinivorans]
MKWNIPNVLTTFRMALIPVFLVVFYLPFEGSHFWSAFIFWLAAITDALDGYIARRFNQFTKFGAFLDPVADKAMVVVAFVIVVEDYNSAWVSIPALTMICREIIVSALREWMARIGKETQVKVSNLGKLKTVAQMLALIGLLWQANTFIESLSFGLLYLAFVLTIWSMYEYIKAAWADLSEN